MASTLRRGDIYLYEFKKPDKKRPVVILSRDDVIPLLNTVIYDVPSEVVVGIEHGLKHTSAINLDHIQTVDKNRLTTFISHLDSTTFQIVCEALVSAVNCQQNSA